MNEKELEKSCELLGIGFAADRIVKERNSPLAESYVEKIIRGKALVKGNEMSATAVEDLTWYSLFLRWFAKTHARNNYFSQEEFDKHVTEVIELIKSWHHDNATPFESFWNYIRHYTLAEVSKIMYPRLENVHFFS